MITMYYVIFHMSGVTCLMSLVTCHLLCVTCHQSPFTCHLSLTPTATATNPPSANSPTMHSRLVSEDHNSPKKCITLNIIDFHRLRPLGFRSQPTVDNEGVSRGMVCGCGCWR